MTDINYLKSIINNRTCFVLLPGQSATELEEKVTALAKYDICWTSLNAYEVFENHILNQINKKFDIILDCCSVPHARIPHYEEYARKPRLSKFLQREDKNLWITTHGTIRDSVTPYYPNFLEEYTHKILMIDSIFPSENRSKWMDVPNSATFLIASLLAGGAKSIITFGLDGYKGDIQNGVLSYYRPAHAMAERIYAFGDVQDAGINRDTSNFELRFADVIAEYRKLFNNYAPILNCSHLSLYTYPPKIDFIEIGDIIDGTSKY